MKGLLQSKRFRKNLKKWLCMYVGALLLLTTVITYSKYISKFNLDDEARVTKFDVTIKNIENENLSCTGEIEKLECTTTSTYRPTTKIPYEFIVEPNFEVNTLLSTTIYVPANFNIETLEEINGKVLYDYEKEEEKDSSITINKIKNKNEEGVEVDTATIITITKKIDVTDTDNSNTSKSYKVTIKYNYDEEKYDSEAKENLSVIRVGYSATQIKN